MDVQAILAGKISRLPVGEHTAGLKAVLLHIETAVRHLIRGQTDADESAFVDAIYRCNQAFEGSVKEAYRVLAAKAPERKTPAQIEDFLLKNDLLRIRVLDQFKNYRTEWRNPSTHDYMLDFDEDEALLAIVSVTVFAIVLCDQIEGKLAFSIAEAQVVDPNAPTEIDDLLSAVADKVRDFAADCQIPSHLLEGARNAYVKLEGALGGYLAGEFSKVPGVVVEQNVRMNDQETDVLVRRGEALVPIEIKLFKHQKNATSVLEGAMFQALRFVAKEHVIGVVVLLFAINERDYAVRSSKSVIGDRLRIVAGREAAARIPI